MEETINVLMNQSLDPKDITYINELESKLNLGDNFSEVIEGIKIFYFKKGLKSGLNISQYCEE